MKKSAVSNVSIISKLYDWGSTVAVFYFGKFQNDKLIIIFGLLDTIIIRITSNTIQKIKL